MNFVVWCIALRKCPLADSILANVKAEVYIQKTFGYSINTTAKNKFWEGPKIYTFYENLIFYNIKIKKAFFTDDFC